jgi:hypothetical protein
MTTPDMIRYWREAAEAAEAKIIEQREIIESLSIRLETAQKQSVENRKLMLSAKLAVQDANNSKKGA